MEEEEWPSSAPKEVWLGWGAIAQFVALAVLVWLWSREGALRERAEALREEERRGRVAAERRLAVRGPESAESPYSAVGVVRSVFPHRNGTPRSSGWVRSARARVELNTKQVSPQALRGLEAFSHVWVVFEFHANTNAHKSRRELRPLVAPPRLDGVRVGLFATRSPHRYVPLGLSLCRLEAVRLDRAMILLSGIDLLDGTPVLDIKPYSPAHDRWPAEADIRIPSWLNEPVQEWPVVMTDVALKALHRARPAGSSSSRFYPTADEFSTFLQDVLRFDIRSHHRRSHLAELDHYVVFDGLLVQFTIQPRDDDPSKEQCLIQSIKKFDPKEDQRFIELQ